MSRPGERLTWRQWALVAWFYVLAAASLVMGVWALGDGVHFAGVMMTVWFIACLWRAVSAPAEYRELNRRRARAATRAVRGPYDGGVPLAARPPDLTQQFAYNGTPLPDPRVVDMVWPVSPRGAQWAERALGNEWDPNKTPDKQPSRFPCGLRVAAAGLVVLASVVWLAGGWSW